MPVAQKQSNIQGDPKVGQLGVEERSFLRNFAAGMWRLSPRKREQHVQKSCGGREQTKDRRKKKKKVMYMDTDGGFCILERPSRHIGEG